VKYFFFHIVGRYSFADVSPYGSHEQRHGVPTHLLRAFGATLDDDDDDDDAGQLVFLQ
jgi:hypothetical protein